MGKDIELANKLFRKTVGNGCSFGKSCLGYSYLVGLGVEKDVEKGLGFLREAAEDVSKTAKFRLGVCYKNGCRVERDEFLAFEYFEESAGLLDINAQFQIAECYWNGQGVGEDREEALALYWKAQECGSKDALSMSCYSTMQGRHRHSRSGAIALVA